MIDDGLGGEFTEVQNSISTASLTISNLRSGRSYRIKYAARNIVYDQLNMYNCDSLKFSSSLLVLTAVNPGSPQSLVQDPILKFKTAIVVQWMAPIEDGG